MRIGVVRFKRSVVIAMAMIGVASFGIAAAQTSPPASATAAQTLTAKPAPEQGLIYTASQDGRTIYTWKPVEGMPPRYIGKSTAVLAE